MIMYGKNGISSAERELGALSASIVNRYIYCAAVHASRFISLTNRSDVVEINFTDERDAKLEARQQALFGFAKSRPHRSKPPTMTHARWQTPN
jgi:uncharacterized peroxidase-related enzyme